MSITKAGYSWDKTLVLGFLAGSLIGIGAVLCSVVSGSSPALASNNPGLASFVKGAIGFPAGELFPKIHSLSQLCLAAFVEMITFNLIAPHDERS